MKTTAVLSALALAASAAEASLTTHNTSYDFMVTTVYEAYAAVSMLMPTTADEETLFMKYITLFFEVETELKAGQHKYPYYADRLQTLFDDAAALDAKYKSLPEDYKAQDVTPANLLSHAGVVPPYCDLVFDTTEQILLPLHNKTFSAWHKAERKAIEASVQNGADAEQLVEQLQAYLAALHANRAAASLYSDVQGQLMDDAVEEYKIWYDDKGDDNEDDDNEEDDNEEQGGEVMSPLVEPRMHNTTYQFMVTTVYDAYASVGMLLPTTAADELLLQSYLKLLFEVETELKAGQQKYPYYADRLQSFFDNAAEYDAKYKTLPEDYKAYNLTLENLLAYANAAQPFCDVLLDPTELILLPLNNKTFSVWHDAEREAIQSSVQNGTDAEQLGQQIQAYQDVLFQNQEAASLYSNTLGHIVADAVEEYEISFDEDDENDEDDKDEEQDGSK